MTTYSLPVFIILLGLAVLLPVDWPVRNSRVRGISQVFASASLVLAFLFSAYSNFRPIQADIAFKAGQIFAEPDGWEVALSIYHRAIRLAPNVDHYYLYLGHASLEYARLLPDGPSREEFIEKARQDLRKAQSISPLNPDHTANLARLYALWSTFSDIPTVRRQRAVISDEYFDTAPQISPNRAILWDEKADLNLKALEGPERAYELVPHSLQLDPTYDWTYALLGEYYDHTLAVRSADEPEKKKAALENAAHNYRTALDQGKRSATADSLSDYAKWSARRRSAEH